MKVILNCSTLVFRKLKNYQELKDSTVAFLSHYTKALTKAQKSSVEEMLDAIGYGEENSIFSKLDLLFLPFLAGTVDECLFDPTSNTDIKELTNTDTSIFELTALGKLVNTSTSASKTINLTSYLRDKGLVGPNVSEGFFGLTKSIDGIDWSGGTTCMRYPFSNASNVIACWATLNYVVDGTKVGVLKTGTMVKDYIGFSAGNNNNVWVYGATKGTFAGNEEAICAATTGKELQVLSITKSSGFKAMFVGGYLTEEELQTLMSAINTCITDLYA